MKLIQFSIIIVLLAKMISKFSISQAMLALAIAYFAYALLSFTKAIPDFVQTVNKMTPHISTIVEEVKLVRAEVTQVRSVVNAQVPAMLSQIDQTRPLLALSLAQSEQYLQQLPILWQHLAAIEMQMQKLQQDLPKALVRVDEVVASSNKGIIELSLWRAHSTKYIAEIEQSRANIPQYLTRVENIILDAKTIGKEASSGLVSGFLKGVISLPKEMVAGLTGMVDTQSRSAKFLVANDVVLMQEKVLSLLNNQSKSQAFWQNDNSGNRGTITKQAPFKREGLTCHKLVFVNSFKNQQEKLEKIMCKDSKELWQVM